MSDSLICFVSRPGGIDDRIASVLNNGYTKEDIGALRGLYQSELGTALIDPVKKDNEISDAEMLEAANKLMQFKQELSKRHLRELNDSSSHMARTFSQLYNVEGWGEATRRDRINMVATDFTAEISRRVRLAEAQGRSLSREDIVNGYRVNGTSYEGQASIFESLFYKYLSNYSAAFGIVKDASSYDAATVSQAKHAVEEYGKVLNNWPALCAYARMTLRNTESLKLGQTLEYAAPTSPDNFTTDSPMEDYYDLEESVREAWMEHQSSTSTFGSLGAEVRRFLSTIPDVNENGEKITDDLGYVRKMDPLSTHQYLAQVLRGITTESGMINKLYSLSKTDPRVRAIFQALAKAAKVSLVTKDANGREVFRSISDANRPANPTIITQLKEDLHKNYVSCSALVRTKSGKVISKDLSKKTNPLHAEYLLRMSLGEDIDPSAVYDSNGNIRWENLGRWYAESKEMLPAVDKESSNIFDQRTLYNTGFWDKNLSSSARIDYLVRASKALGIPMDIPAARKIYNNSTLRTKYLTALQEFRTESAKANSGITEALTTIAKYNGVTPAVSAGFTADQREEFLKAMEVLKASTINFESFKKEKYGRSKYGVGEEKIAKMLDIIADVTDNLRVERRIPWFDRKGKANSRYLDRTPSYMGDLVEKIHEFVNNGDAEGLRGFIMDKWGKSSFFYDKATGKFLNRWLQEMYDSITTDSKGRTVINQDAFAKIFQFDEFLGSNIDRQVSVFENFTEKQHAEGMIKEFLQLRDNRSTLAKYPSFILGDSGVQMFFTARRYERSSILDGLKNVFRQELERIKYVDAVNKSLTDGGYKTIDNFSKTANEFTMLTFLNKNFKDGKYWKILTGNNDMTASEVEKMSVEDAMKEAKSAVGTDALTKALETYMEDALAEFKDKLASLGVLSTARDRDGVTRYFDSREYFAQDLGSYHNNLNEMLEDFYWNTKYATIQQLQMFTVDPAFYDYRYPIKDLQKRYKEIYAPGKGLSLEARDLSPEHKLYMDRDYERVAYFNDIEVSAADYNPPFMNMIEREFPNRPDVVKAYRENTLTDGQGYRILESYRAVRGMASEWTPAMEDAYNRIQEIRRGGAISDESMRELASLAALFQPVKPYLFTLEKLKINEEGDVALIPVQHKYAEVVLIPELMNEGKLKDMAIWMENHVDENGKPAPIDLIVSTKCVKVGAFGSVELKSANTPELINGALDKAFIHNLSWADYRIQSSVPEHLNHAQLFGTQIRKLILSGIKKSGIDPKTKERVGDYQRYLANIFREPTTDENGLTVNIPGIGDVHLTGQNLISFYNSLIMANMFDSFELFEKDVATNKALSEKMINNVISNANQAEDNAFAFSLIEEDKTGAGEFVVPPCEPGLEHDATGLFTSLFKKAVNKQKIKGGSAVQASPMGLSGRKARSLNIQGRSAEEVGDLFEVVSPEGDNVLYDEIEMPWNLSYTSADGANIALRREDWCNEDGTLKLSDKIVYGEDAREYLSWPVSGRDEYGRPQGELDENGYDKQGYYVPLIETKYKGILDIIAYRIPTERDYSMINAKVFRFTPAVAGGTMKVPASRTTTAGFDFDIDKLYFFMREFKQRELSKKEKYDIWTSIYKAHPKFANALREAQEKDALIADKLEVIAKEFQHSRMMQDLSKANKETGHEDTLYLYWDAAKAAEPNDIPAETAEQAFTKYLEDHRKEYPIFETYNRHNSPLNPVLAKDGSVITGGNTRAARNNMLIDLMRQRLMDKETLKARYTPGGFNNNRDAALRMRVLQFADKADISTNGMIDWSKVDRYVQDIKDKKLKDPEPEYDPSDPTAILVYNQQNQVAAKLIGIFANQNTNHVYASTMHQLGLMHPIKFGNHASTGLYDLLHGPEEVDVDTNVAEYLAASVDAVKDPVLNFLNLNLTTADAGALLARIGYTPQEIGLLFNQPIIKDLCTYAANRNTTADVAIAQMLKTYGGQTATFNNFNFDSQLVTTDALANNILKQREFTENKQARTREFNENQLHVLYLFNEIMSDTNDLNSFVQCTRFTAANSVGSTWGDQIAQQDRVKAFITKYMQDDPNGDSQRLYFELFDPESIRNTRVIRAGEANLSTTNQGILNIDEQLLDLSPEEYTAQMSRNPLAFEQCMMDMGRKMSKKTFGRFFPYYSQLYTNMRNIMGRLTRYGNLEADAVNSLHREFMVYLLSKQLGSNFDGSAINERLKDYPMSNREYYSRQYPVILETLKSEGVLAEFPFFSLLNITGDEDAASSKDALQITVNGVGGLQSKASSRIMELWAAAANSPAVVHSNLIGQDFNVKDLAEDFYFYNFYHLGYNFHPTSSMSLAPTALKLNLRVKSAEDEIGYIDFINDVLHGDIHMDSNDLISFAKQYILNHLDDRKFVFTPASDILAPVLKKAYNDGNGTWNPSFTISLNELGKDVSSLYLVKDDEAKKKNYYAFRPVLALERTVDGKTTTVYYMADGVEAQFNYSSKASGAMTYRQVFPQGMKGQSLQYFSHSDFGAFQREGKLATENQRLTVKELSQRRVVDEVASTFEDTTSPQFIELNTDVTNMFTEAQWSEMVKTFREKFPTVTQGIHDDVIKANLMDTSDQTNVDILNELSEKFRKGELKTIDENGEEIEVCGV